MYKKDNVYTDPGRDPDLSDLERYKMKIFSDPKNTERLIKAILMLIQNMEKELFLRLFFP